MLKWTRIEQIGFSFHLLDSNNDGLICIQDMFQLMSRLKDNDNIIAVDINKLTNILKQKSDHLINTRFISPLTFGIPFIKNENNTL